MGGARIATRRKRAIRLRVLPTHELLVDGVRLNLCPASQRLLCFLALQGGRPVQRSLVSGSLWPEASEEKANASLRSAIWRLAQDTGDALIGASLTHLWLEPTIAVDLTSAAERARALLGLDAIGPGSVDLAEDLHHLSSDVLVGLYEDWALDEQERFRQLRLHALEWLGELLLRAGRYADGVRVGVVAVAAEPLRESAQRLLLRAHLAEGNVTEVLRQYRTYADLAISELGIQPSRQMVQLVEGALAHAAQPGWSVQADVATSAALV
jgi:DNA-binding SARP family transcriptional activator